MPSKSQSEVRGKKILATLKEHYELGCKAKESCCPSTEKSSKAKAKKSPKAKSPKTIAEFASTNGIDVRTARMRLAFALQYSPDDFEEFCELRRLVKSQSKGAAKESLTLPLLSAHVTYLLTIEAAVESWNKKNAPAELYARDVRKEYAQLAADKNLTPAQLHDEIRKKFGRNKTEAHGRKHLMDSKLKISVGRFLDQGESWFARGQFLVEKIIADPKLKKQKVVDQLRSALSAGEALCRELDGLLSQGDEPTEMTKAQRLWAEAQLARLQRYSNSKPTEGVDDQKETTLSLAGR